MANPMHSAAVVQLREDNAELRGENARLKERLRQHEDGDDIEVKENKEKIATTSVPKQQGAVEAVDMSVGEL
jgi:regulator of replication initiation timing